MANVSDSVNSMFLTAPSSTDPAIAQEMAALGIPTGDQRGEQFVLEETGAFQGQGGNASWWNGWKMPANVSPDDFWRVYSLAEKFAANTGWSHLPPPSLITRAFQEGWANRDDNEIFRIFGDHMGVQQSQPWARYGMNQTQWKDRMSSLNAVSQELFGGDSWGAGGLDPSILENALQFNWGADQIRHAAIKTGGAEGARGYLKQNMSYQDFQNYKQQNHEKLTQRFGANYNDEQAVQDLAAPLQAVHAAGGPVEQPKPDQQGNFNMHSQASYR